MNIKSVLSNEEIYKYSFDKGVYADTVFDIQNKVLHKLYNNTLNEHSADCEIEQCHFTYQVDNNVVVDTSIVHGGSFDEYRLYANNCMVNYFEENSLPPSGIYSIYVTFARKSEADGSIVHTVTAPPIVKKETK